MLYLVRHQSLLFIYHFGLWQSSPWWWGFECTHRDLFVWTTFGLSANRLFNGSSAIIQSFHFYKRHFYALTDGWSFIASDHFPATIKCELKALPSWLSALTGLLFQLQSSNFLKITYYRERGKFLFHFFVLRASKKMDLKRKRLTKLSLLPGYLFCVSTLQSFSPWWSSGQGKHPFLLFYLTNTRFF